MENRLPQGTETVLVVDDEAQILAATSQILQRLGYTALTAGSAEEALDLAGSRDFDLLIMDIVLPQMSGLALAHKISTIRPGTRILFSSAYTSEEVLDDHMERRPGVAFLQKPFTAGQLARSVRSVLRTHRVSSPQAEDPPEGRGESILVVDDDPHTQRFMTRALERLGYHVLEARNPDQALAFTGKSDVHLAILDVVMPRMTGPELARAIRQGKPRVRILYVSGKAPEELGREDGAGEEGMGFLAKPFTAIELGKAVRELLDA